MKILNVVLLVSLIPSSLLAETRKPLFGPTDFKFHQDNASHPSAACMAMDYSHGYRLSWAEKSFVSAELAGFQERKPYKTQGIPMPDLYQGKLRMAETLEDGSAWAVLAGVTKTKLTEPQVSLGAEYRTGMALSWKADYLTDGTSHWRLGLGLSKGIMTFEYLFEPERAQHRVGLVTRLG